MITVSCSPSPVAAVMLRCNISLMTYRLNGLFGFVLGGNEVERAKPDPEPVLITLSHFQVSPEETLVVGDMTYDILMGRRAGCRTCGVSYGNGSQQELLDAGADRVVDDFADILCQ